jgi:porin
VNPILFAGGPYTTLTGAVILIPTDWLQIASFIAGNDPNGAATTTGFNTAFHSPNWLSVGQEFDFTVKPFGQTGHQRIGWFYTTKDVLEFGTDSRIQNPGARNTRSLGILPRQFKRFIPRWLRVARLGNTVYSASDPETSPDNWGMYYNFDQYLCTETEDPKQGWGLFGRFGFAPTDSNFISQFYSLGVGGRGTIPCRDNDTWGVGYYLANTSDKIDLINVSAEQGVEVFYNFEITKWLNITPDIQCIIDPGVGFQDREPAIVYGLRAQIKL